MMRRGFCVVIVMLALAAAFPACAKDWIVDYTQSHLGFTGTQGSDKFDGGFKKFRVVIDFDPAQPQAGKITAVIDIASAFAGSEERDSALPQSDWFDTSKFPQAQFTTTSIKLDECNVITPATVVVIGCYKAAATLMIKGIEKPVTLGFYLEKDKQTDQVRAKGDVKLIRTDFGVGKGQWSDEAYVKHAVDVTIDIVARPVP
jgi:polyisoprenoid-binding protein YceI